MPKSLAEFKDRVKAEADWIIPGLLKRGNTGFIIGQPKKAAKSWLILDACWSLSEGEPVWGIKKKNGDFLFTPEREMRCVYFTQEDTEDDIHDRTLAHFSTGRAPNDRLWIVPKNLKINFDTETGRALMQQELDAVREQAGPIDLICFDPMRRMHHGDENDSAVIAKMWEVLDRIHKRYACATLFSHHTRKPPQDRTSYDPTDPYTARGSGDIYGGGDAFMTIVPGKLTTTSDGVQTGRKVGMFFESKRGKPLMPAQLKIHFDTGAVEYLGVGWEEKSQEMEVNI